MLDITSSVVLAIALMSMYILIKWTGIFDNKNYPPGPWGVPILGHLPLFGKNPGRTFIKWWQKYGDVVRVRFGSWNTVIVNGYDAIKDASERSDDVFSDRPNFVTHAILKETLDGLGTLAFANFSPKYLQLRKFTEMTLRNYTATCECSPEHLMVEEAEQLAEKLLKYPTEKPVSCISDVEFTVESIIYQMLYGKGKESEIEPHVQLIVDSTATFNKFVGSGNIVDVVPWLRYIMRKTVDQFKTIVLTTDWIRKTQMEEHMASFVEGYTRDIADALCVLSKDLPATETDDSICPRHLMYVPAALQGAAFETTSRTILYLVLYMIAYPDVQTRVHRELNAIVGTKRVKWADRARLPYVHATIQEVMRKTSIVPFALPHYAMADTTLCGYNIDQDTVVMFNFHSVANDPVFWGDPDNFRPERLLTVDGRLDNNKCAHILPFGAGRRRCVGEKLATMEIFIIFSILMQRCSFSKADDIELDMEPIQSFILSPKPFTCMIQPRQ